MRYPSPGIDVFSTLEKFEGDRSIISVIIPHMKILDSGWSRAMD